MRARQQRRKVFIMGIGRGEALSAALSLYQWKNERYSCPKIQQMSWLGHRFPIWDGSARRFWVLKNSARVCCLSKKH
jgi:hypothetical protein